MDSMNTSRAALESVDTTALEVRVLGVIASRTSGMISDEVRDQLPGLAYSSVTARFKALEAKGLIERGEWLKRGKSGRYQKVMRATGLGLRLLSEVSCHDQEGADA